MTVSATSVEEERDALARWRLRAEYQPHAHLLQELVDNEFAPPEEIRGRALDALSTILRYSGANVPYYRDAWTGEGLQRAALTRPEDLVRYPVLNKEDLRRKSEQLCTQSLPAGEEVRFRTESSGTTGQPVAVFHTTRSRQPYPLFRQRAYRWYRFDPNAVLALIVPARDMVPQADGTPYPNTMTIHRPGWPDVGQLFETGPFVGYAHTNPIPRQLDWLERFRVRHLVSQAANLEHLALTHDARNDLGELKSVLSISQQMTRAMRSLIERRMDVAVNINYGLNEIGLVAAMCRAGRYHVFTEHCWVELLDDADQPARPGEHGRIIITALLNAAMPLIRYDTGDYALVTEGPCACGRTLPSFGQIRDRYRRLAYLPEGTWRYWVALQIAIENMPEHLSSSMQQYQLHQRRDNTCVFRVRPAGELPDGFVDYLTSAWTTVGSDFGFEVMPVEEIPRGPGGKFENFISDYSPSDPDAFDAT